MKFKGLFIICIILVINTITNAQTIYDYSMPEKNYVWSVQVAAKNDEVEKAAIYTDLKTLSITDTYEISEDGFTKILVGSYEYSVDAQIAKKELRAKGFKDAFIKKVESDKGLSVSGYTQPLGKKIFPNISMESTIIEKIDEKRSESSQVKSLFEAKDFNGTISKGIEYINSIPEGDAVKGFIANKVGESYLMKEKSNIKAIPYFLKVATGEIKASKNDIESAKLMAADSYHYFSGRGEKEKEIKLADRYSAYLAYKEILESGNITPDVKARVMVEIAACMMEFAHSSVALHEEVRMACKKITNEIPANYKRAHAVAEIMFAETYFYQQRKDESIAALKDFDKRYPGLVRENAMANLMLGCALSDIGRWGEGKALLEKNLTLDLTSSDETFYFGIEPFDMKGKSAFWIKSFAIINEDKETAEKYEQYIIDSEKQKVSIAPANPFPNSIYQKSEEPAK